MDSESIYTDDAITKVAKTVAEKIVGSRASEVMRPYLFKSEQWNKGPLAMFTMWSDSHNPLGRFGIEAETLTVAQKRIVVNIVGDAMTKPISNK